MRYKEIQRVQNLVIYLLLSVGALVTILPFLWMLVTSLRLPAESFRLPPKWIPTDFRWRNYVEVCTMLPFMAFFWNSLKVSIMITAGQLVTCSMAAFAFARLRFKGRDILFVLFLSSLMIPSQVTIIPIFILVKKLNLLDTHAALILPSLFSAFGIFLLRQFFLTIPRELEEAAIIDGATPMTVFLRVILPLSGGALSTLAIFTFNSSWNEFFRPLIFLNSYEKMTIPLGLRVIQGYFTTGSVSVIMAGVSLALIPVTVAFILAQRYLIEGITLTGLKE